MNLNLGKFKKLKEDAQSATLQHPDGHQIRIAKSVLSKKLRDELGTLSLHMNKGDEVPYRTAGAQEEQARASDPNYQPQYPGVGGDVNNPVPKTQPTVIINNTPPQASQGIPNYNPNAPWQAMGPSPMQQMALSSPDTSAQERSNIEKALAAQEMDNQRRAQADAERVQSFNQYAAAHNLPMQPEPQVAGPQIKRAAQEQIPEDKGPQQPIDPYGTQAYLENYQSGMEKEQAGIAQEAQALGAQGEASAAIAKAAAEQQQARVKSYDEHFAELNQERKAFINDIRNQHIDANHYFQDMGVGGILATTVGLILGGFGGGLTHQGNPAQDMLNKAIDRDIEAQKDNLNKSNNLLTANMHQYGNLKDAVDMTRVMLTDAVSNQLKEAAATAQTPMAKANALKASGQLEMQSAPVLSQIAMRKSITGNMQSGNMDPSQVIRMVVPAGQQDNAYKELKEAQEMTRARDNLISAFDKLDKINTVGGRISRPLQSPKEVNAIKDPLIAQLSKATAGRFTEADSKFIGTLFPAPGDDAQTVKTKHIQLKKLIEEKMNFPILKAYGIDMNAAGGASKYGAGGEKKIQMGAPVVAER